jgi:hypothetical protein
MAMPMERPTIFASASGELKHALRAEFALQACCGFEYAALPFHRSQAFFAAAIGHVFAEDDDALVAFHLIEQSDGNHFDHRFRMAFFLGRRFEIAGGGIHVRRVNPLVNRVRCRKFSSERAIRSFDDFAVHFSFERFNFAFFEDAFAHQEQGELWQWVALRFGGAFGLTLVELFVVGKRVRIGAVTCAWNQRRAFAGAAMIGGAACNDCVTFQRIGAVTLFDVEVRIISDQLGNAAAGSLYFDRDGNGVAVVFDQIKNRQTFAAGSIQGFVKFAFAGGALARRNVNTLVAVKRDRGAHGSLARLVESFGKFLEIRASIPPRRSPARIACRWVKSA